MSALAHGASDRDRLSDQILVVEDEFLIAEGYRTLIEEMGLRVCAVTGRAEDAIVLAQKLRPKVVLMDVRLAGALDGVDAALAIHDTVGSKVVFITGSREPATLTRIKLDHPAAILFKPILDQQLKSAIEAARAA